MEAIWEYLSRNLKIAWKSVFYNWKQYICFFLAIFIVQMFYGIMAISTENNKEVERAHVEAEFDYDMVLTNLSNFQYTLVKEYNNSVIYKAAAESFYLIDHDKTVEYTDVIESDMDAGMEVKEYDVYITFSEYEKEEARDKFMKEFVNGTLASYGDVHYEETDLITFEKNIEANNMTFLAISAVLLVVSVFLLIALYKIRINQYKFTYGVYMTVGATFRSLFGTAFWELFLISLVTFIPAMTASTVTVWLIYKSSGFPFTFFLPGMWFIVGLFSLLVVTISVISPMRIMSLRTPMSLIRTEDNSNLVSSPRRSINLLGKKFPAHYEIYSIWRFRKYNIQLLTSAIAFCALFIMGLYLGNIYNTNIDFSKPQYTVDLSDSEFYYNAGAQQAGDDHAVNAEILIGKDDGTGNLVGGIDGITYVEQTGDEKGNFTGEIAGFSSPQTEAEYISSFTMFPTDTAKFLTNFLNHEGWKATNEVIYRATDWEQIKYLEQYNYTGDLSQVLDRSSGVKYCIVGDSISNMQKFDIQPGDTIKIAKKVGQQKDVDSNASGRSLLKQQLKYFEYEYTEFVVAAVLHDIPSGSLPVYILGEDYEACTGISPNATLLNVYTRPDLDNDRVLEVMQEIKEKFGFSNIGTVHVTNNRRISLQSIAADKHNSELYIVISALILVISPLIWFFNQILYYRKREKEFNIIQSMGAKESDIRVIYLLGGLSMAIMSLVVSILLSYVASYAVYYFVNAILPSLNDDIIRYEFYLPWYALVISAVVSVACGFFSTYVPYKSYFKNRFSLENGGSGMKDD